MENKRTKLEQELELLLLLREAVNSEEEFNWVESELVQVRSALVEVAHG